MHAARSAPAMELAIAVHGPQERLPLAPDTEEQLYLLVREAPANTVKRAHRPRRRSISRRLMMRSRSRWVMPAAASLPPMHARRASACVACTAAQRSSAGDWRSPAHQVAARSFASRSQRQPAVARVVRRRTRDRRAGARAHCRARAAAYVAARHHRMRVSCATAFVERRAAVLSPSRRVAGHAFSHTRAGALAGHLSARQYAHRARQAYAGGARSPRPEMARAAVRGPARWMGALSRSRACVHCRRGWPCRTRPARRRR